MSSRRSSSARFSSSSSTSTVSSNGSLPVWQDMTISTNGMEQEEDLKNKKNDHVFLEEDDDDDDDDEEEEEEEEDVHECNTIESLRDSMLSNLYSFHFRSTSQLPEEKRMKT